MLRLPVELLDCVVAECDFASLKRLRCTCRALARLTTPRIFEHVHIAMLTDSLRNICSIAAHAEIRNVVKRLTYHGELLPSYENREEYVQVIDMRPSFRQFSRMFCRQKGLPVPSADNLMYVRNRAAERTAYATWIGLPRVDPGIDLDASYRRYRSIYEEQQEWDEERLLMLRRAMCSLPNLERAEVATYGMGTPKNHGPVWGRLFPQILQGPDNWKLFDTNTEDCLGMRLVAAQQISHLLEAMCERASNPVRSLKLTTITDAFWRQATRLPFVRHAVRPAELGGLEIDSGVYEMRYAFEHLTHLELIVTFARISNHRNRIGSGMRAFLQEAKNLESLRFEYTEYTDDVDDGADDFWTDPLQVLGDVHWPRLRTLHATFATREALLIDLLSRHSATLKHLSLVDMTLLEGHGFWTSAIEQIPHVLELEHIYLESPRDSSCEDNCLDQLVSSTDGQYERSIVDYCLNGGPVPLIHPHDYNRVHLHDPGPGCVLWPSDSEASEKEDGEEEGETLTQ